jgi:hypothetical protein
LSIVFLDAWEDILVHWRIDRNHKLPAVYDSDGMAQTVSIIVGPEDFRPSRPTSSSPSSATFLHLLSVSVHQAITAAEAAVGLEINFVHSPMAAARTTVRKAKANIAGVTRRRHAGQSSRDQRSESAKAVRNYVSIRFQTR